MDMMIVRATKADGDDVIRLAFELLEHEASIDERNRVSQPEELKQSILEKLENDSSRAWFLAKVDGRNVGIARVQLGDSKIGPKRGYLSFLYVEPAFRRKGIGKALTEARLQWLKDQGIKFVQTDIMPGNHASLSNLAKYDPKPWYQLYTFEI